jgi:dCTP deaminase
MILSDVKIRELLDSDEIHFSPLEDYQIQPASIDLRLGSHFLKVKEEKDAVMDLDNPPEYDTIEADEIILPPNSFILATTIEYMRIPNYLTGFVEGRSSIGRMGLFIQNAGWIDPGFEGEITLELYNANHLPIKLQRNRRICQIVLATMDQTTPNPYRGKYQGQKAATGSRVFQDKERKKDLS